MRKSLRHKAKPRFLLEDRQDKLKLLKEFSLKAPFAIDPEVLFNAIDFLDKNGWNVEKAALRFNNRQMKAIDDAYLDDPFG